MTWQDLRNKGAVQAPSFLPLWSFLLITALAWSWLTWGAHAASDSVPNIPLAEAQEESFELAPYMSAFVDESGTLSVQDIQNPQIQKKFSPLQSGYEQDFGVLWLRFTLSAKANTTEDPTYLLDLGSALAQKALLFVPEVQNPMQWQEYTPSSRGIFLMPEQQDTTITAYIRLHGLPNLWFSTVLRTPHNAATSFELLAYPAAIVGLFVVMLLCLLRGVSGKGQWRYWAGLYTAVVLYHAIVGIPSYATAHIPMGDLSAVLAPGVALILWAHVARHIMNTPQQSRAIDIQYVLLTAVGMVVALLPLVPGFTWTVRYVELWPLLLLLFVPTSLAACMSGYVGSRRFLIACLVPPLAVAVALVGLLPPVGFSLLPMGMLAALPLWGVALGTLFLVGTTTADAWHEQGQDAAHDAHSSVESLVESDPNLRLVPVEEAQSLDTEEQQDEDSAPKRAISPLEEQLRWPVEQLSRHVSALEDCALPVAAKESIQSLSTVSKEILQILHAPARERMAVPSMGGIEDNIFDLQSLLRQAHDSVSPVADKKNIALSWFMPPHLAQCYKGDALQLLFVLRLLLESSVRSTHRGAVQLAVRRVPESVNPGHLLFTITDTGTGKPPQDRSVTALARAWELSASYHGFLGVECNAHGASISFTVHCEVCSFTQKDATPTPQEEKNNPIILLSDNTDERHMWRFFLEKVEHPVAEARSGEQVADIYKEHGSSLIIVDTRMPSVSLEQTMQTLYKISQEKEENFPVCLAIYAPDPTLPEPERYFEAFGFTHCMPLPVTKQSLCSHLEAILAQQTIEKIVQHQEDIGSITEEVTDFILAEQEQKQLETQNDAAENAYEEDDEPYSFEDALAQEEQDTQVQEEDIIDTGIPILEMGDQRSTAKPVAPSTLPEPLMDMSFDAPTPAQAALDEMDMTLDMTPDMEQGQKSTLEFNAEPVQNTDPLDSEVQALIEELSEEFMEEVHKDAEEEYAKHASDAEHTSNSLGDAILLGGVDDEPQVTQKAYEEQEEAGSIADVLSDQERHFIQKHSPNVADDELMEEMLQSSESAFEQNHATGSTRPAPSADKSNAAYLTSLIGMDDDEEQDSEVKEEPAPVPMSEAALTVQKLLASISNDSEGKNSKEQDSKEQESDVSVLSHEEVADGVTLHEATRPVVRVQPRSMLRPKGTVPFEHAKASSHSGGGEWVGEPVPVGTKIVKKSPVVLSTKKNVAEKPKVNLVAQLAAATQELQSSLQGDQWVGEPTPINKDVAVANTKEKLTPQEEQQQEPQQVPEPMFEPKSEPSFVPEKETPHRVEQMEEHVSSPAASELLDMGPAEQPEPKRSLLGSLLGLRKSPKPAPAPVTAPSQEWVGEPMPVAVQVSKKSEEKLGLQEDDPLSMTPLGAKAAEDLPELTFHRDTDAEERGRAELNHLRQYLDELHNEEGEKEEGHSTESVEEFFEDISSTSDVSANLDDATAVNPSASNPHGPNEAPDESPDETASGESAPDESASQVFAQQEPLQASTEEDTLKPKVFSPFAWEAKPTLQEDATVQAETEMEENAVSATEENVPLEIPEGLNPIEQLLYELDAYLAQAHEELRVGHWKGVEQSAAAMANSAEIFGLRTLGRLSRTVEAAAKAGDQNALEDLLPELDMSVQRNKAALQA